MKLASQGRLTLHRRPADHDRVAMGEERIRLDKWLWCARFYRSRALAQAACGSGRLRLNGNRVEKPGREVRPGDVLTIPRPGEILAVRVLAAAERRGSAKQAQALYEIVADAKGSLDPAARAP